MSFCNRLREARKGSGMTQSQMADALGIAKSTLSGYENGTSEPSINMIGEIIKLLGVDANYLWQDSADFTVSVSFDEMKLIENYRSLDDHSKSIVDFVLHEELDRSEVNK